MKPLRIVALFFFLLQSFYGFTQTTDEAALIAFQQQIDNDVVAANIPALQKAYAEDFRFKHSTGLVDNKESWLKDVAKNKGDFISRQHTEVEAEIHGDIGITYGKLTVLRKSKNYYLKYVRVYRKTGGQWQMIMHRSVEELTQ